MFESKYSRQPQAQAQEQTQNQAHGPAQHTGQEGFGNSANPADAGPNAGSAPSLAGLLRKFQSPPWLVKEMQERLVLFLNHVLMQEEEAMARLKRHKGRLVRAEWASALWLGGLTFSMQVRITPAGLFNLEWPLELEQALPAHGNIAGGHAASGHATNKNTVSNVVPDLLLRINEDSPLRIAEYLLKGEKPPVHVAGDVQLAAEINWLTANVRWDVEEDLSRILGDAPAHTLGRIAQRMAQGLRSFVDSNAPRS